MTVRDLVRARDDIRGFNDISDIVARDETRLDVLASETDPRVSEAFSDEDYRNVAGVAAHYGRPLPEQRALARGRALVDLSHRAVLSVSGPDRLSWLHTLGTQHVETLPPGTSTEILFLDVQGRIEHAAHLLEDGAAAWARRTGGAVVELHAYAVPDDVTDETVLADLRTRLDLLHPELAGARPVHEEVLIERDCPLVGTDAWAARPGVLTPDADVVLAGDGIRCEMPVALMERAATTGFQAANHLLARWGLPGHDLWSVPTSTRFPRATSALRAAARARPRGGVRRERPRT